MVLLEGDVVDVYCYNSSGSIVNPNMKITIGSITDTSATFTISYNTIDTVTKITKDDINNDKVYDKLLSIKNTTFYTNTFDDVETLDLASLDITSIEFLNQFDFKNLKYLVLFGNKISGLTGLNTFITNHPNTIIILDNNLIDLKNLDNNLLTQSNVFYGLQNTASNSSILNYYINSSFNAGNYQICYQFEDYSMKYLKNEGAGTLEMLENVPLDISSYYFFTDKNYKSYKYRICYNTNDSEPDPITLSLNESSNIELELGDNFNDPSVTTNYPSNLSTVITLNGIAVSNINSLGTYTITYTVSTDTDTKSITRTVTVADTVAPQVRLKGASEYVALAYTEDNIFYEDLSACIVTIKYTENGTTIDKITKPGNYLVEYTVTDTSNNTSVLSRTVKILTPEEAIEATNDAYSISYEEVYYSLDGVKLKEKPETGSYNIEYTIYDMYGNNITYTKTIAPSSEEIKNNIIVGVVAVTIILSFTTVGGIVIFKIKKKYR